MATSTQASLQAAMFSDIPSVACVSHPIPQSQAPPRVRPTDLLDEVLHLQGLMNVVLEQLFTTRASIDSHHREVALNVELAVQIKKAQTVEAIKEAEMSHTATVKDAEVCHTTTIKEVQVHHAAAIKEAEVHHITNACGLQPMYRGKHTGTGA